MLNANKLKGAMVSAGYTQKTLAKEMGISPNTLSAKINGGSSITMDEVERICTILGISESWRKCEIFLS